MARVLIVDDEESIRITLREFLSNDGHEVVVAPDALEALDHLRAGQFDVLVSDIILPKLSGVDLLNTVKEDFPDLITVLVTGEPNVDTAASAVRKGAFDYLYKPVSKDMILGVVERAAHVKTLNDEKRALEFENRRYRTKLEELVAKRTSALHESQELYKLLFDNVSDIIFSIEPDQRIRSMSPSVEKLLGFSPEKITGRVIGELPFLDSEAGQAARDDALRVLTGQQVPAVTYEMKTANGEIRFGEARTSPLTQNGEVIAAICVIRDITDRKRAEGELHNTVTNLRKTMGGIIHAMEMTIEKRDPYTAGHQRRVANLAHAIAEKMDFSDDELDGIRMAGVIHDLGKIYVPAEILSKPGKITDGEFNLIKVHSQVGYDILKTIDFQWPLAQAVLQHHERINGTGYPQGLTADQIIPEAKILSVADVVEAMSSHRPYRPALGMNKALEEITANRGILYDVDAVDCCMQVVEEGFLFE
jgi:PAS domain S-box-containing protein